MWWLLRTLPFLIFCHSSESFSQAFLQTGSRAHVFIFPHTQNSQIHNLIQDTWVTSSDHVIINSEMKKKTNTFSILPNILYTKRHTVLVVKSIPFTVLLYNTLHLEFYISTPAAIHQFKQYHLIHLLPSALSTLWSKATPTISYVTSPFDWLLPTRTSPCKHWPMRKMQVGTTCDSVPKVSKLVRCSSGHFIFFNASV